MHFPTEASSSSAVRTARDIVADFGENLAELSGGIASLAKTSEKKQWTKLSSINGTSV